MMCRLQDVRTFIGAVFNELGAGMSRAGLAWDLAQDHLEHMQVGSGARNFGLWEDAAGTHTTEWSRQHPELHKVLMHIAHVCMQLQHVRAVRLSRGQRHLGPWPDCSRSLIIWWWPRDPANMREASP